MASGLTPEQVTQFERDGYTVVDAWLDDAAISTLRSAAERVVESCDTTTISVFSTNEQTRTSDDHFLESGDKVGEGGRPPPGGCGPRPAETLV